MNEWILKFVAIIEIQSNMTRVMKSVKHLISKGLYVNQFSQHVVPIILA